MIFLSWLILTLPNVCKAFKSNYNAFNGYKYPVSDQTSNSNYDPRNSKYFSYFGNYYNQYSNLLPGGGYRILGTLPYESHNIKGFRTLNDIGLSNTNLPARYQSRTYSPSNLDSEETLVETYLPPKFVELQKPVYDFRKFSQIS